MANMPSIPKGTRDFSPTEMLRRKYIFSTIENVFRKYGFLPLETPAMENLSTLTGKYGEEGDRLIFKVLNSGDAWKNVSSDVKAKLSKEEEVHPGKLATELSDKALRYDLTVPFARYVVQHRHEISFPFKRYQIQPVWRADRPQKGRYREFYQCDADVIGSKSLLNEVELLYLIDEVFKQLGLEVEILFNNRKILAALARRVGVKDNVVAFATVLDKLDKIGRDRVYEELRQIGASDEAIKEIDEDLNFLGPNDSAWPHNKKDLEWAFQEDSEGQKGIEEVDFLWDNRPGSRMGVSIHFDITLARGLDYYTGAIFEVKAKEGSLKSSICGGGRYDDLTGIFGLKDMSGVGISFGADRIYDVLLETNKFPADLGSSTQLLFANFGEQEAMHALKLLHSVRDAGVAAELYPDTVKMAKQFKYADDKGIPFVAIIGENELKQGIVTVKDMRSGEQKAVKEDELLSVIS